MGRLTGLRRSVILVAPACLRGIVQGCQDLETRSLRAALSGRPSASLLRSAAGWRPEDGSSVTCARSMTDLGVPAHECVERC